MNRPTPPGPLHTGARLGPDDSTMTTQSTPTSGALRAAIICMRLSGGIKGPIPDERLVQWGVVQSMAEKIDREAVKPATEELLTALREIEQQCSGALNNAFPEDAPDIIDHLRAFVGAAIAKHQGRA